MAIVMHSPPSSVAEDVESYNKDSFVIWRTSLSDSNYKKEMAKLRWEVSRLQAQSYLLLTSVWYFLLLSPHHQNWKYNESGNYAEIDKWLTQPNNTYEWAVIPSEHPQSPP
jgi:hypothetical protein